LLLGQVGIGTNAPVTSSILDLNSTTQGFLPPRMTYAQMTAITTPTLGLMVYCTDCEPQGLYHYDGSYFLNSNRGTTSGNLSSFIGNSIVHEGVISTFSQYSPSDGITTSIGVNNWPFDIHNPISFGSTGRLGYIATLVNFVEDVSIGGLLESGAIPDSQLSASTEYTTNVHAAINGRLNSTVGSNWAAMAPLDTNQYFQVDLGRVRTVSGVATQGGHNAAQWITSYIIQYSNDGTNFTNYNGGEILSANTDQNTVVRNDFSPRINARYVRFNPQTFQGHITGRFEVYETKGNAIFQIEGTSERGFNANLDLAPTFNVSIGGQSLTFSRTTINVVVAAGLESGAIPDSQLSASSFLLSHTKADSGRLNMAGSNWIADGSDTNPYFQVDLGRIEIVSAVASQGRQDFPQWVLTYSIQYSNDNVNFTDYNGGAVFTANTNQNTIVRNDFSPLIRARYIRILPLSFNTRVAGRFEVYIVQR